ncbi:hypothetical protein EYF80_053858 [Liparis tanakae]|uniref:Uncharacterized protein n=1 Tax=Liparis tanakae TaxID=230148 RepID=A0A4Z2F4F7_9TELE|nr:hypothetical protein EYF80_053858 [Liparis tanakae]
MLCPGSRVKEPYSLKMASGEASAALSSQGDDVERDRGHVHGEALGVRQQEAERAAELPLALQRVDQREGEAQRVDQQVGCTQQQQQQQHSVVSVRGTSSLRTSSQEVHKSFQNKCSSRYEPRVVEYADYQLFITVLFIVFLYLYWPKVPVLRYFYRYLYWPRVPVLRSLYLYLYRWGPPVTCTLSSLMGSSWKVTPSSTTVGGAGGAGPGVAFRASMTLKGVQPAAPWPETQVNHRRDEVIAPFKVQ